MTGLKSNFFVNILCLFGALGIFYLVALCGYLLIAGLVDFLEGLVP